MFNDLVSSMEPLCLALSQQVEEAFVHRCYLWTLVEGDWRLRLELVTLKPLWMPRGQQWMRYPAFLPERHLPREL